MKLNHYAHTALACFFCDRSVICYRLKMLKEENIKNHEEEGIVPLHAKFMPFPDGGGNFAASKGR